MKKLNLVIAMVTLAALVACNGNTNTDEKKETNVEDTTKTTENTDGGLKKGMEVDYRMFENPEKIKELFAETKAKLGGNITKTDEVRFDISRPSKEGMIKREGEPDNLSINVVTQSSADPRKVHEVVFSSNSGWDAGEDKEIQVFGVGSENFKLEDELFDFTAVTPEIVSQVVKDGAATFDAAKYEYIYPENIKITKGEIYVYYQGKLQSNGVEKSESYKTDFTGKKK